jgi:hypothetical protein
LRTTSSDLKTAAAHESHRISTAFRRIAETRILYSQHAYLKAIEMNTGSLNVQKRNCRAPWGLAWRSDKKFIVTTIAIGLITDLSLYALFIPVLPFMLTDRCSTPEDEIQGQVSNLLAAYAGSSVLISPIVGFVADLFGSRKAPFLFGIASLASATVLLMLGRTITVLYVARMLQGISAAFVWTVGLAFCLETVGPADLGKALGAVCSNAFYPCLSSES